MIKFPPFKRTKEAIRALERITSLSIQTIPLLERMAAERIPTPHWAPTEIERAFLLGFLEGQRHAKNY